jgi:hypothetical protein
MKVTITSNFAKTIEGLDAIAQRGIPGAQIATLTQLAYRTKRAVYDEMDLVLEPPLKRYTLTSMRVDPATFKSGPVSSVYLNDWRDEDKSLGHLFRGGDRRWKKMEGAMWRKGLMPAGYYAVPGQGAPIDQYGNIPAAFVRRILGYFGALNEGNLLTKTKERMAKKGKVDGFKSIQGVEYFVSFGKGKTGRLRASQGFEPQYQHLAAGIYSRSGVHGVRVMPIIMFVPKKKPYRKYIDLYGLGLRVLDQNKDQYFAANLMQSITGNKTFEKFVQVSG